MGKHLMHWEEVGDKNVACLEFLQWLEDEYRIRLDFDYCDPDNPAPISHQALVDEFFEVDRKGIEKERRELLRSMREINKAAASETG